MKFIVIFFAILYWAWSLKDNKNAKVKITGNKYVGTGYDYLTNEFKFNIFKKTFNFSDTEHAWKNPFYPGDIEFVPSEQYLTNTPESYSTEGEIIHHLLDNYTREYTYHYSHSGLFCKSSTTIYYYLHRMLVMDNSKGFAYKRIAWYTLELQPIILFDPWSYVDDGFKYAYDQLPENINSPIDLMKYKEFVNAFGTSYIRQAVLGGELMLNAWMHNCFLETQEISWVKHQTSFSFLGIISWGKTREEYFKKVDTKFVEHVEMDMESKGGIWKNGSTWEQFSKSLVGDLIQPIYYQFEPITDLFTNAKKKQNMQGVINDYIKEQTDAYNAVIAEQKKEPKDPRPSYCSSLKYNKKD